MEFSFNIKDRIADCEFCEELEDFRSSRFARQYSDRLDGRIVARYQDFVAIPTLGQLFKGSLLILPQKHIETTASLNDVELSDLEVFIQSLESRIELWGHPVLFEHGARCSTGGSCGIYHAHIHLVPLPTMISVQDVMPEPSFAMDATLRECLSSLRRSSEYLMFRDGHRGYGSIDLTNSACHSYASQYFRRRLVAYYSLNMDWNWRAYSTIEPWLSETLDYFQSA